ncbi:MAG: selenide, water dikinase SelD [Deltaproteobacteria bacterium CG1_02_45_11]|nr:MAG: selenide, water dikinase SelD [Deltaproteobacteria bacterium CG1_02_45_11]
MPVKSHPDLLVGIENSDDAGVYRLDSERALVQTLDFFTPIVDSPYDFGRIAAANALSDIYAMGGKPITAMNIVCFPDGELSEDILKETLAGGLEKIYEAGAVLVGGHSVDDREFKYGLSITGLVHPEKILTNLNAKVGDRLILTKPIGLGVIATAIKGKIADKEAIKTLVDIASALNKRAAEIMLRFNPHACTDITGYGLAGHVLEMAKGGKKKIVLYAGLIPFISRAKEYARMGLIPAGCYTTKSFCEKNVSVDSSIDKVLCDMIFDPQTSGGLVIALEEMDAQECLKAMGDEGIEASMIGEVLGDHHQGHVSILP